MEFVLQPRRIKEGRLFRDFSQQDIADNLGVTKQSISQYENGVMIPNLETVYQLADMLEFPLTYFSKPYNEQIITPIFFRKRKTSSKKMITVFETYIEWMVDIYCYLNRYLYLPPLNIIHEDKVYYSDEEIIQATIELRRSWGLGNGPISNLTTLLENNGFVISKTGLDAKKVDACSVMFTSATEKNRSMVFLTSGTSAVRSRRDLAHELGHQVLHSWMSREDFEENREIIEHEADLFASHFLMPGDAMERESFAVDSLNSLLLMKKRWGASMQNILYHLRDLECIDSSLFDKLSFNFYHRGWKSREPLDDEISQEKPELIKDAITMLVENNVKTAVDIAEDSCLPKSELASLCGLPKSFFEAKNINRVSLQLVK